MYFFVDPEVFNPLPKSFHLLEVKSLQQLRRQLTFREKYFPEIPSRWILIKFSLKMLQNSLVIHEQNITSSKNLATNWNCFVFSRIFRPLRQKNRKANGKKESISGKVFYDARLVWVDFLDGKRKSPNIERPNRTRPNRKRPNRKRPNRKKSL